MAIEQIRDAMCIRALQVVATWKSLAGIELDDPLHLENFFDRDRMMLTLDPIAKLGYPEAVDFAVLFMITVSAKTFLFDTEQIKLFMRAIDKKVPPRTVEPPFPSIVVQFTEPIPEGVFTSGSYTWSAYQDNMDRSTGDLITGFVVAFPTAYVGASTEAMAKVVRAEGQADAINVILFYESGELNRAALPMDGDGSALEKYTEGKATEETKRDKQRICNLAMLVLSYLNSPNIEVQKVEAHPNIQRRRQKDGKPPIEPYYVSRASKKSYVRLAERSEPSGRHVGFRFDVAGHFRHYKDGKTVWVLPHQRGLEHDRYVPKIYRVDYTDKGSE